jgi:CBS domain-containing protein
MRRTVRGLLDVKQGELWSVKPEESVLDALRLMADKNIGAVVVRDDDGALCGIMSERDYARKIILASRASHDTPVSAIMTAEVTTVDPQASVEDCMSLMTEGKFRHLPVVDDGELVGLISIGDVVRSIIDGQQSMIVDLERLIVG